MSDDASTAPLALWRDAPGRAALRPGALGDGPCLVRTKASLISRGTERLVHEGQVPETEWERMRAPFQEGDFPFPVKYGYAAVGEVILDESGAGLEGRKVFALFPHQSHFRLAPQHLVPLPAGVSVRRAALAANMETALNALWDAGLGPGDRVAVVGAGLVGCLVARLAARTPGVEVTLIDVNARRADVAAQLNVSFAVAEGGAQDCDRPCDIDGPCDIVFHASASAGGLRAAIDLLGDEGTLVEMSWYGAREVPVALGGAFHSRRLQIVSSQVGQVAPSRRPRWTHRRRLEAALALCDDPTLDALIDREVAFADLPAALPEILAPDAPGIGTLVRYD